MNIADIQFPVFKPYNKPAIEIYLSGCNRRCIDCHNEELWDFNFGKPLIIEDLIKYLKNKQDWFECIGVTGGDLLCQNKTEAALLSAELRIAFVDKKMWLFTGENKFSAIPEWVMQIYDVIKHGSYIKELKIEGFPASSNQKMWKK